MILTKSSCFSLFYLNFIGKIFNFIYLNNFRGTHIILLNIHKILQKSIHKIHLCINIVQHSHNHYNQYILNSFHIHNYPNIHKFYSHLCSYKYHIPVNNHKYYILLHCNKVCNHTNDHIHNH